MTPEERRTLLEGIAAEVRGCTRCRLAETRTTAVPGEGHPETEVVFVGEGPGFNEDQQGRPFVGAAGALLTELLGSVGWRRQDVFITNVVKCRPPGNRDPEPDEMAACRPYLERQLEALDPALVVTLGRFSLGTFLPGSRIGETHGQTRRGPSDGVAPEATVYPMYHPAAAFRQTALRETLLEDMLGAPQALLDARERRSAAAGAEAAITEPVAAGPPDTDTAVETAHVRADGPPTAPASDGTPPGPDGGGADILPGPDAEPSSARTPDVPGAVAEAPIDARPPGSASDAHVFDAPPFEPTAFDMSAFDAPVSEPPVFDAPPIDRSPPPEPEPETGPEAVPEPATLAPAPTVTPTPIDLRLDELEVPVVPDHDLHPHPDQMSLF